MGASGGRRPRAATNGDGTTLAVNLLGPLEVSVGGRPVGLTAGRLRTVLAVLAASAGEAVSVDRLAGAIWDGEPPEDIRRTVQTYMTRLRDALGAEAIGTTPAGYVLAAEPERVDAFQFLRLLDAAATAPDAAGELALLCQALALWRGRPFEGVRSGWLENAEAPRLVERYLAAVERRIDLEVAKGRHTTRLAPLRSLVEQHPLRESLWLRLLVVLAWAGRQAEALEAYETVRARLAEELGTDPGPELRRAHADLLKGRPPEIIAGGDPAPPPGWPVPRQLPPDAADFTGRDAELAQLRRLLTATGGRAGTTLPVIYGAGGIGKSALAIHAAHELAGRFPDGQLYVDLRGATAGLLPLAPLEALGRFLRALGVGGGEIPTQLEEAAALFRSVAAGRRLLLVLDNAADAAQVEPLLPASPGCAAVVTSRRALSSLPGMRHLPLDGLTPAEAVALLGRVAGPARVAAEPEAAADVARWCGSLPLAVRIAGSRLAARPTWPVGALAERLSDQQRRLDELETADTGVRAIFAVSWGQLADGEDPTDRAAAGAFELLGTLDGPELSTPVVARLLDVPVERAERVLERLVDAHLLETPSPGRYRLHDLLRLYGRELAAPRRPQPAIAAALTRALGFYAATAWHTLPLLYPADNRLGRIDDRWRQGGLRFGGEGAALEWLEAERSNLVAAVEQAAATPGVPGAIATQLAHALFGYFRIRNYWAEWVQVNETARGVARRDGDRVAEAQTANDLGLAYWRQSRFDESLATLHDALTLRRAIGDRRGQGGSLNNLGLVNLRRGDHDRALACLQESLPLTRETGDRHCEAACLSNLGVVYELRGRHEEALACLGEGLALYGTFGDRDGQAYCFNYLGVVHSRLGRYEEALACQRESLALRRALGDRHCQAETLRELGVTLRALGDHDEASAHWRQALFLFEQLKSAQAGEIRALLAGA